jgi:hypothetical protein
MFNRHKTKIKTKIKVGGQVFRHASGLTDPVAVIAEHSLDGTPDHIDVPRGYRSRTVGANESDTDELTHRRSA